MEIVKRAKIKQGITYSDPKSVGGPEGLLAKLVPFDSQGAMWARRFEGDPWSRKVSNTFNGPWDRLEPSFLHKRPLYVVWSYQTPIGFVTCCGSTYVPDEKYSTTTTHHQNLVKVWMGFRSVWSDQDQTFICPMTQAVRDAEEGVWV